MSKIFEGLTGQEIEEGAEIAKNLVKELVGRNVFTLAVTGVVLVEFITRHTDYTSDDIISAVEFLKKYNDDRDDVGSMTVSTKPIGMN